MRKASYVITFFAVLATLLLNIFSTTRTDWITYSYRSPLIAGARYTRYFGLNKLCELEIVTGFPDNNSSWSSYSCRKFPARKVDCANDYVSGTFCDLWTSAGYTAELGIGFAAMTLVSIIFGVSTHSRRRRIWRAVAVLTGLQAALQIVSFSIITHLYRTEAYPNFDQAKPGLAYVFNTVSWVVGVIAAAGVVITGIAADRGIKWAAGNRAYARIHG